MIALMGSLIKNLLNSLDFAQIVNSENKLKTPAVAPLTKFQFEFNRILRKEISRMQLISYYLSVHAAKFREYLNVRNIFNTTFINVVIFYLFFDQLKNGFKNLTICLWYI